MRYLYLHGLASSPNSTKARQLGDRALACGLDWEVPDLNGGDFSTLTLTRQIQQVRSLVGEIPTVLVGSSLGGLTAAWVAQQTLAVERLILLAPAFGFPDPWLKPDDRAVWQNTGYLEIYHYGEGCELPLHYQFVEDLRRCDSRELMRPVDTTIFHGVRDDTIPISASREYVKTRPYARLVELDSDHRLTDAIARIWEAIEPCGKTS
ncbi:YqiA/YcfP family alpha/beta fold hydrolase [Baaleninema simplex]|uniref:YqiA/YcfP family alpha/beta fold hydrolase n=1 Tax=Baaleninema simplex TaxID=2862350 RepID=UPI0003460BD0|nr:YqiA/YcfP family alpha/beta fold hydrolase [Baaleninema simplex]